MLLPAGGTEHAPGHVGSLLKTLGSISIAVDTARPVVGQLIITELIASPPNGVNRPRRRQWNSRNMAAVRQGRLARAVLWLKIIQDRHAAGRNQSLRGALFA